MNMQNWLGLNTCDPKEIKQQATALKASAVGQWSETSGQTPEADINYALGGLLDLLAQIGEALNSLTPLRSKLESLQVADDNDRQLVAQSARKFLGALEQELNALRLDLEGGYGLVLQLKRLSLSTDSATAAPRNPASGLYLRHLEALTLRVKEGLDRLTSRDCERPSRLSIRVDLINQVLTTFTGAV